MSVDLRISVIALSDQGQAIGQSHDFDGPWSKEVARSSLCELLSNAKTSTSRLLLLAVGMVRHKSEEQADGLTNS